MNKISYAYFFQFKRKKSSPRSVKYLYAYTDKGDVGMGPLEEYLKRIYFANYIRCGKFTTAKFYRVVDMKEDMGEIRKAQKAYLKKLYLARLLICLFFLSSCVIAWITNDANMVMSVIVNVFGIVLSAYILNCVIGLLFLSKNKIG